MASAKYCMDFPTGSIVLQTGQTPINEINERIWYSVIFINTKISALFSCYTFWFCTRYFFF